MARYLKINPFKLRDDLRSGNVFFEAAKGCLGEPHQISVVNSMKIMNWRVMDNFSQHTITIGHEEGHERITFEWESESFSNGNAVCVNYKTFSPSWPDKIADFIVKIKKPWEEWSEEEFLCSPMWIYYFFRSNGSVPASFHNAMVLASYGPHDDYVKRYFQECQSSLPEPSPG